MMRENDGIIQIGDDLFRLEGIENVIVSFAKEENPTLVDTILRMVLQGSEIMYRGSGD